MNKPYNQNEELVAMKQDIADRSFGVRVKELGITGVAAVLGGVAGYLLAPATGGMSILIGGALGMAAGGTIGSVMTMKEREKLKIDQDMVDSYMSGKNYWGEGYREEVAEKGYGFGGGSPLPASAPPPPSQDRGR